MTALRLKLRSLKTKLRGNRLVGNTSLCLNCTTGSEFIKVLPRPILSRSADCRNRTFS